MEWSNRGILKAYVCMLTSCETVLGRPYLLSHEVVRPREPCDLHDATKPTRDEPVFAGVACQMRRFFLNAFHYEG